MKLSPITCSLALVAGFVVVWMMDMMMAKPLRAEAVGGEPMLDRVDLSSFRESKAGESRVVDTVDYDDLAESLRRAGNADVASILRTRDHSELIEILEYYRALAGFQGLSSADKNVYKKILNHLYAEDADAALKWCDNLYSKLDRRLELSNLIQSTARDDFPLAYKQMLKYMRKDDGILEVPRDMFALAAERSPEDFIMMSKAYIAMERKLSEKYTRLEKANKGGCGFGLEAPYSSYGRIKFPEGFPFQQVASELNTLVNGKRMDFIPTNLISEWAKVDPQSLHDWLANGGGLFKEHRVKSFLKDYKGSSN